MADMTAAQWATLVLQDLGAPTSANNMAFMSQWMASENDPATWTGTAGHDNPLNNGYGSGGGSGLGSYPDLVTAAKDVAANLKAGNYGYSAVVGHLMQSADPSVTAQAIIASGWAESHYNDGKNWAGGAQPYTATSGGGGTQYPNVNPATGAALKTAMNEPGGAAYLSAAAGQNQAAQALSSTTVGGQTFSATTQQQDAIQAFETNLQNFGFTGAQALQLAKWGWGEITSGKDTTQIALEFQQQPAFLQAFPYYTSSNNALISKGLPAISVQDYRNYQVYAFSQAQAMGLPPGFMTQKEIGQLISNNVSQTELGARLNDAMVIGLNSTLEQQQQFNQFFGVSYGDSGHGPLSPGQLAALALDPNHAEPLIKQQIQAAQIGGASVTSGVGSLGVQTALELARAGISTSQATSTFQNLAPYATLEHARPGMHGEAQQGVVSPTQLATGALLGNTQAERQLQTAVEVAKAPFSGGGGFVQNAKGAAGTGSASPTGVGGT